MTSEKTDDHGLNDGFIDAFDTAFVMPERVFRSYIDAVFFPSCKAPNIQQQLRLREDVEISGGVGVAGSEVGEATDI